MQIVEDIPNPLMESLPMVLIKPPEACPTAEVYKVISDHLLSYFELKFLGFSHKLLLLLQRFRLAQASKADPLTLLKEITQNGISQDVCVNDLGMHIL
jgi:4-diphosphocytidyl-2-C-methyl-D-erythritol kinase